MYLIDGLFASNVALTRRDAGMFRRVYLDNSATTPVDREVVVEAMLPFLTENSAMRRASIFSARRQRPRSIRPVIKSPHSLNARPNEIVFTSGGTEANNLAIRGLTRSQRQVRRHVSSPRRSNIRRSKASAKTSKTRIRVTYLPVYENGIVQVEDCRRPPIREDTVLISIMTANNEIGTIQPVAEIGRLVKELRSDRAKRSGFTPTPFRPPARSRSMSRR